MRCKIEGKIIEQFDPSKTSLNHETYSMILSNVNTERAKQIHCKKRFKRLFTFSRIFINGDKIHLYVSGEDEFLKEFINYILCNQIIRIGDKVISVTNLQPLNNKLAKKDEYIFKRNIIVNEKENGKVCLSKDFDYIKRRINEIAKAKYTDVYGKENEQNIEVEILKSKQRYIRYKDHHLNSYDMVYKIKGNYDLINLIYNVGCGENTASGHGLMWEVQSA